MKIKTVEIKNFQSLRDIKVDFEEKGVYRFKGLNNTGKSAFLKAITALMRNVSNNNYKDFLRDGEDTFQVRMTDFEGNWVTLSRGAVDFYEWEIGGHRERVDKTKGKVPQMLQRYFNLYEENEKTKECLNIRLPREVLLFIDTTAGDNAMMLQKALGTEEYMLGIKRVDRQGREINKEVTILEKYLDKETEKLDESKSELTLKRQKLDEIERYESTLKEEYETYKNISMLVQDTQDLGMQQRELREKKDILADLEFESVQSDLDVLQKVTGLVGKYEERKEKEQALKEKREQLNKIEDDDILGDLKTLETISDMIKVATKATRSKKIITQKREELKEKEREIQEFKEELGVCPFCGADMDETHVHDGSGDE